MFTTTDGNRLTLMKTFQMLFAGFFQHKPELQGVFLVLQGVFLVDQQKKSSFDVSQPLSKTDTFQILFQETMSQPENR